MATRRSLLRRSVGLVLLCLFVTAAVGSGSVSGYTHIVSAVVHGTTGDRDNQDVWAYERVERGSAMQYATIGVADGSDIKDMTRCYGSCWRVDVHHERLGGRGECAFRVYAYVYQRLPGHYQDAC